MPISVAVSGKQKETDEEMKLEPLSGQDGDTDIKQERNVGDEL